MALVHSHLFAASFPINLLMNQPSLLFQRMLTVCTFQLWTISLHSNQPEIRVCSFFKGEGGWWWDLKGGAWIKYDLKGGDTEGNNILGVKGGGGSPKKIPSSFAVMASVIMQTAACQNAKNQHFWPSESSHFPRKRLPRPPNVHVLHTKKQFYPNKMQKSIPNWMFLWRKKQQTAFRKCVLHYW